MSIKDVPIDALCITIYLALIFIGGVYGCGYGKDLDYTKQVREMRGIPKESKVKAIPRSILNYLSNHSLEFRRKT